MTILTRIKSVLATAVTPRGLTFTSIVGVQSASFAAMARFLMPEWSCILRQPPEFQIKASFSFD
jgi:hypothetical protein